MSLVIIDEEEFDVGIVKITRKASLRQTSLGTTLDGKKHYEVQGTYYDYEVTFNTRTMALSEYDRLYETITAPVETHLVSLPYGQTTIEFEAHLKASNDSLVSSYTQGKKWGGITAIFEAVEPQREA